MTQVGQGAGMWDEEDGFVYDVLRLPNGQSQRLKVRSMVGLLPLCAATTFDGKLVAMYPELGDRLRRFLDARPEIIEAIHDPRKPGVADRRLASIMDETKLRRVLAILRDKDGRRPIYGGTEKFQNDPHWRDCLSFHEYFHGDNGAGLGASHQTGWTGVVARLMHVFATVDPKKLLEGGKGTYAELLAAE